MELKLKDEILRLKKENAKLKSQIEDLIDMREATEREANWEKECRNHNVPHEY